MNPADIALQVGSHPWFFFGAALLLGALHGLEPGHSKGIMTAFLLGTQGTYAQAVVLAACATLSHTAVVWILALPASYGGLWWATIPLGPYLNLISGCLILFLAFWMLRRFRQISFPHSHTTHHHDHGDHHHDHGDHHHDTGDHHPGDHSASEAAPTSASVLAWQEVLAEEDDEHARFHLREVAKQFSGQKVSTGQVALFGLGTGLTPCSAALVILISCFKLHQPGVGLALVAVFSLGLGLTLTSVALLAAWGTHHFGLRCEALRRLTKNAPFFSALLTAGVGIYLIVQFFRSY